MMAISQKDEICSYAIKVNFVNVRLSYNTISLDDKSM